MKIHIKDLSKKIYAGFLKDFENKVYEVFTLKILSKIFGENMGRSSKE
jgi:hypothetical protein